MGRRLQLHELLTEITPHVYFTPPEDLKITYPCITYERDYTETAFADNGVYRNTKRYLVTVIDQDPDSDIPERVSNLPLCRFSRFFAADQLNHDIFNLYY